MQLAMTHETPPSSDDVAAIRALIERWAAAVHRHDYEGILADHDRNIVMFDVPPPIRSQGIDAYRRTWDLFFTGHQRSDPFDVLELEVRRHQNACPTPSISNACIRIDPLTQRR
jgi:ketosteroid isomerase-like protein